MKNRLVRLGYCAMLFLSFFILSASPCFGVVNVNRNAASAVEWMVRVEDAISRARTFYRTVEALGETGDSSPVVSFYTQRRSVKQITQILPELFGKKEFSLFMPDWPALAPVSWAWVEPTERGIFMYEAGKNEDINKKTKNPLWTVDVALPSLPRGERQGRFFKSAFQTVSESVPSLRFEDDTLLFTIFPSASMTRGLIEETYRLKVESIIKGKK